MELFASEFFNPDLDAVLLVPGNAFKKGIDKTDE